MASTVFLKSAERIMALAMIMTLSLLVYSALEHRIRESLKMHQKTFPNQKGQPIHHPTARWVFQFFTGIHLLVMASMGEIVLNLKEAHQTLLTLLVNTLSPYMRILDEGGGMSVLRKPRTWLALRRIPVSAAISCCAALIVAGGWA